MSDAKTLHVLFLRGFSDAANMTVERAKIEWDAFASDGFMDEAARIEFERGGYAGGIDAGMEYITYGKAIER